MKMQLFNKVKKYLQQYAEGIFWATALTILFFMDAVKTAPSLCMFKWLYLGYCPGCGLGHSINSALHLQFATSFKQHPMGIAAILIILNRIKQLFFNLKFTLQ
jgi:hypothetical protein